MSCKVLLLINLGTPDQPTQSAVHRYLSQFLSDRRVLGMSFIKRNLLVRGIIAPIRSGLLTPWKRDTSTALYQQLWTKEGSPIKTHLELLGKEVKLKLGDNYRVEVAMRYQNPNIKTVLDDLKDKIEEIILLPLFPQYASATTGSVLEACIGHISQWTNIPNIKIIDKYCTHQGMINAFAEQGKYFDIKEYDHYIFSFHGLPLSQIRASDTNGVCCMDNSCCQDLSSHNSYCYIAQCQATTRALIRDMSLNPIQTTLCFQSKFGNEEWTQPYLDDVIDDLIKQQKLRVLVFSPAFVADCLETTIELGYEYKEKFIKKGGEKFDLVPSLNSTPLWVDAIVDMVENI